MGKVSKQINKPDHAFILAAGKGTRLRPYTDDCPKPLVAINGRPILDYTLDKLQETGVSNVTINLNYLGDRIKTYLNACTEPKITFSVETEHLETGGGVKKALHTMDNKPFYLINGDALWTEGTSGSALDRLAIDWNSEKMDILLLLQPVNSMNLTHGVGDYDLTPEGQAVRSIDKSGAYMFTGIRISSSNIFEGTPNGAFSFRYLMDTAQEKGRLHGLIHDGEWHHISTPEDLERVSKAMAQNNTKTENDNPHKVGAVI